MEVRNLRENLLDTTNELLPTGDHPVAGVLVGGVLVGLISAGRDLVVLAGRGHHSRGVSTNRCCTA